MLAIIFAFLAISSCGFAAPREKRFAGSSAMSYAGPSGTYTNTGPGRTFSSTMRSGTSSTSGFGGGFGPYFPFPIPMPMPSFFPFAPSPWNWPVPRDIPVPWQMGPNVCNETQIFESPENDELKEAMKKMGINYYSSGNIDRTEEICQGDCGNYACMTKKMTDSGMKTKLIRYYCCDGFQLEADPKWGGWKSGCYEKSKEEADSQIPSNKEKEEDEPTESPSWKDRMRYSHLSSSNSGSSSNSDEGTGVEKVSPQ